MELISLRQLRSFVVLAEELHFRQAAARIRIAQPALSRQILQLEQELGVQLLERSTRQVHLTEAGRQYLQEIRPLLDALEFANQRAQLAGGANGGCLRVGFASHLAEGFVHPLVERFQARAPGVRLLLREVPGAVQIEDLEAGRLEVGFATLPIDSASLFRRTLWREPLDALVSTQHPLAAQTEVMFRQLAGENFIVCPRYPKKGYQELITGLAHRAGFKIRIASEVDSRLTAASLAARGVGLLIVPARSTSRVSPKLHRLRIADAWAFAENVVAWRGKTPTTNARVLIDEAVSLARSLRKSGNGLD